MPKLEITSQERSALRASAHPLRPVVQIGNRGLTEPVLKEIESNLAAHQLIKIRVNGAEREEREAMLETICNETSCAPVHHLGKTLIVYRPDAAAEKAAAQTLNATRAVRQANEPYTPKKKAASGINYSRKEEIAKRAAQKTERLQNGAPRTTRAPRAQATVSSGPEHRIPRRTPSALSLRAGARRNTDGRGTKR
jgi:RNA-binding protein